MEFDNLGFIDRGLSSFIDTTLLRFGDAFHLTFAAEVRLKLSKDTQHIQKAFSSWGRGIDGLFGCPEMNTL